MQPCYVENDEEAIPMDIPKVTEDMAWALEEALKSDFWDVEIEGFEDGDDTYFGCICLNCLTERGVFGVFSRLEIYVCPVEENNDEDRAQLTFIFYAEPGAVARIIGPDKRTLGRSLKRDECQAFKSFSFALIGKAGLKATECSGEVRCPGSYREFKDGYSTASYEVELEFPGVRKADAVH